MKWIQADLASSSVHTNTSTGITSTPSPHPTSNTATTTNGKANWTIVYSHRPFYCSNTGGSDVPKGNVVIRGELEEVLLANKVDLVVSGHVHGPLTPNP